MCLQKIGLMVMFADVKNEGSNFSTMTFALTYGVSCEILGFLTPFVRACGGHTMSKC
jgi:hypothetical protein